MKIFTILIISIFTITSLNARPFRIDQIPNGTLNRCSNCHVNPNGGGTLTPFGTEVKNNFLENMNVVWNSELASIDSDGDGYTNGEELQDPNGEWSIGISAPGDINLVSNPGIQSSIPNTTSVEDFALKTGLFIKSIAPNPVKDISTLSLHAVNSGNLKIELFNTAGGFELELLNTDLIPGEHSMVFQINNKVESGLYFAKISFNGFSMIEKLIVVK